MKLSNLSLKTRIQILVTVLLIISVGAPLFMLVHQVDKIQEELSGNMVESATQLVYRSAFDAFMVRDTVQLQRIMENFAQRSDIRSMRLFRPDGRIVYSSRVQELGKSIYDLPDPAHSRDQDANVEAFIFKDDALVHNHPIYLQNECMSCHVHTDVNELPGVLQVNMALPQAAAIYPQLRLQLILGAFFIIIVMWIAFNFLYESQIESRLQKIIKGFDKLKNGDLSARVDMDGGHELAHLAGRFNETVDALQDARNKEAHLLSENLNHADRLVTMGEVAAEIAHEVNNPVGILRTRAEILKEELEELPNFSAYMDDINEIIRQSDNIAQTTHRVLHYARMTPQEYSKVELNEIVETVLRDFQKRNGGKKITFNFNSDISEAFVTGNGEQLQQALRNLLNNSMESIVREGDISISLKQVEDSRRQKSLYRIAVSDTGPGIDSELESNIFSPFFTTRKDSMHPGLGLFIVRVIAANHRGRVFLEKSDGNGACFVIELEKVND